MIENLKQNKAVLNKQAKGKNHNANRKYVQLNKLENTLP